MEPFIATIMLFAGNFQIRSWAFCWGQLLSISQNTALFSLVGVTYGGNGQTTFALPDLRGRVPIGFGQGPGLPNYSLGQMGGSPTRTLTVNEIPAHNHTVTIRAVSSPGTTNIPTSSTYSAQLVDSRNNPLNAYSTAAPDINSPGGTTSVTGGSQPHDIMQPYLGINYLIALEGIFPPRD